MVTDASTLLKTQSDRINLIQRQLEGKNVCPRRETSRGRYLCVRVRDQLLYYCDYDGSDAVIASESIASAISLCEATEVDRGSFG
jgi:hypothetical protein